ncbi:hypothetical protein AAEH90_20075 [Shewanella algae]|uniref:hypothetical protein n=1 Tax=Shewanella algae TaxID=38313 RepID=UPI001C568158|nr:hypothetical protein [Shewanella algae]
MLPASLYLALWLSIREATFYKDDNHEGCIREQTGFAAVAVTCCSLAVVIGVIAKASDLNDSQKSVQTHGRVSYQRQHSINDIILHQVPEFHFDCGPKDAKLLRAPENYNRYFRVMGIKTKTGMGCSSLGSDLLLPDLPSDTPYGAGLWPNHYRCHA